MTGEVIALVSAVALSVGVGLTLVRTGATSGRYDARRDMWRFRTPAGRFRASLVLHDWKGRVYAVEARYRDHHVETTYCAPSEFQLRAHIRTLTETYRSRRS